MLLSLQSAEALGTPPGEGNGFGDADFYNLASGADCKEEVVLETNYVMV
jgi:hypothetical protein